MKKKYRIKFTYIIKIIVTVLLLYFIFKGVFVLILLIGLSLAMSYIVNNFKLRNFGIELVTFIAVLTALKYGPLVSLVISFILILYHLAAGGFFGPYWFWVIPAWAVAGFICGFFQGADVVTVGIYATIGISLNNIIFTAIFSPTFLPKYMSFPITNIFFNIILFNIFGKFVYYIMV